jgi:chemotaxis protein MotB
MAKRGDKKSITIIKKEEVIAGGHHGGAWKVAYADFVTAMMAFFLLMWLLNATTEAQRRGLADYFSPTIATARGTSGSGQPFGGRSPFEDPPFPTAAPSPP